TLQAPRGPLPEWPGVRRGDVEGGRPALSRLAAQPRAGRRPDQDGARSRGDVAAARNHAFDGDASRVAAADPGGLQPHPAGQAGGQEGLRRLFEPGRPDPAGRLGGGRDRRLPTLARRSGYSPAPFWPSVPAAWPASACSASVPIRRSREPRLAAARMVFCVNCWVNLWCASAAISVGNWTHGDEVVSRIAVTS